MRRAIAVAALALLLGACATTGPTAGGTASQPAAEAEVLAATTEFASAFNALDQARFDALWAEDAAVFFPQAPFPIRRIDGRAEVTGWFKRLLDSQRERGTSPGIEPQDLKVQMLGRDGAVVSFHLGTAADRAARRTLVYRREAAGWKIVHLHGSALTAPKP